MRTHIFRVLALLISLALGGTAFAASPVAVDDSRNIAVNSIGIINVLANDFDIDGDTLSVISTTTSQNAQISINGDGSINYVPATGFVGVDTFSYTIQENNADALTSTATVVVTVFQRDTQDTAVNTPQINIATSIDLVCTRLRGLSDAELGAVRRNLLERCNRLSEIAENNPEALPGILRQISPDEITAITRVARRFGRAHAFSIRQRINQRRIGVNAFTFNGLPASDYGQETGGAAGSGDLVKRFGFFASAILNNSEKETSDVEAGYDADANGFTAGIDYRVNNQLIIGSALGFTDGELEFNTGTGQLKSEESSLLVFGSYSFGEFSYDLQIGYSDTAFNTSRTISYEESGSTFTDTLTGRTNGSQILLNNLVQWSWSDGALSVYPFFKLDFLSTEVDGFAEQGESGFPMVIADQASELFMLGMGAQASYAFGFNWGVWLPSVELGLNSEINNGFNNVEARFAFDTDSDNTFVIENDGGDSAYLQFALGSSFTFKHGASAFVQYQQLLAYEGLSVQQLSGGLRLEF